MIIIMPLPLQRKTLVLCFSLICLFLLGCIQTPSQSGQLTLHVAADPSCSCNTPTPVGDTVKIGILAFCFGAAPGIIPGGASSCGYDLSPNAATSIMSKLVQDAQQLFIDTMEEQQPIPLTNGNRTSFDFTWINLVSVDWGSGAHEIGSLYPANTTAYELFKNITQTTQYGGPFTIIIVPPFIPTDLVAELMKHCENPTGHKCVVIHPFNYQLTHNICGHDPISEAECASRGRFPGQRRWDNMLGVMFDSTWNANSAIEMFRMQDVKSTIVIHDHFTEFGTMAAQQAYDSARQLNIDVYGPIDPIACTVNCEIDPLTGEIDNVFPGNRSAEDMAEYIKSIDPDSVIVVTGPTDTPSTKLFADMFVHFRKIGYTPKAIFIGGGGLVALLRYIADEDKDVLKWAWMAGPWDSRLRGPMYHAVTTRVNYELMNSTVDDDLPQVFVKKFNEKYPNWVPYNFFTGSLQSFPAVGWQSLAIAQKLIETGMTTDVDALMLASTRISTPSLYHYMQFDPFGRTMRVNEMLYQAMDTQDTLKLIAPVNVAEPPIYPLPTWEERIFKADELSDPLEKMMVAITAVAIAYCLSWYGLLANYFRHPVIRASTPSFCALIILGAVFMLMSNFFHSLVATDTDCAAQVWLLTIGFTLIFSGLFIKTARIWKIFFGSKKLAVVKMKDSDLLLAVGAFLATDIIINAVWAGTEGMKAQIHVPDPLRPAYSYSTCDYTNTKPFVFTHLVIKCGLLLFGIGLTWAVRNTPSQFNESTYIGLGIYNVSLILCFVVPILATNAAGRDSYLVRAFAIIFVSCSTISLLYVPKLVSIRRLGTTTSVLGGASVVNAKTDGSLTSGASYGHPTSKDIEMGGGRKSGMQTSHSPAASHGHNAKKSISPVASSPPPAYSPSSPQSNRGTIGNLAGGDTRLFVAQSSKSADKSGFSLPTVATQPPAVVGSNANDNGNAPSSPYHTEPGAAYAVPGAVVQEDDVE